MSKQPIKWEDRDLTKLPQWVRDRLTLLERNLEHYRERERQVVEGDTNVFIQNYRQGNQPLPKGTRIVFVTEDGEFQVWVDGKDIEVRTYGGRGLQVRPSASNAIYIRNGGD
jgi:hypothetical protein